MNCRFLIATALWLLPFSVSYGNNLDAIAVKILDNNPEIKAFSVQNTATLQNMRTENNLPPTDVNFSHLWGHKGIGNKTAIEISQGFDWPGAYGARSEARKATASALELLSQQRRSELMLEIRQQLLILWSLRHKKKVYERAVAKVDSLSRIVERGVEKREVSILDGNKLKIERIALARKLAESIDSYHEAYGLLQRLNGEKPLSDVVSDLENCTINLSLKPLETYYERCEANNPDNAYRQQLTIASRARARAIRLSSYPGFSVGLTHELEMDERYTGFSIGLTLPIFSNRGRAEAARLNTMAIESETEVTNIAVRARIHSDYIRAEKIRDEINQYSAVIESEDNLRLLDKAFNARHISIMDYISDLIYFTDATVNYIDLHQEYYLLVASLERYDSPLR